VFVGDQAPGVRFSAALLKVASRCNLNCDYCYVYNHADQSWRDQPPFMAPSVVGQFAQRLAEYVRATDTAEFSVVFHGGEPLLYGADRLAQAATIVRAAVPAGCALDVSLQTNGTLLTDDGLRALAAAGIQISVSLDGPRWANDRHRLTHAGESSFDATAATLRRLVQDHPGLLRGVIAVIDPDVPARDLFAFFADVGVPRLDLLLPDATHADPPALRDREPDRYRARLPVRWFDAVLASRLGVPSPTDAMGFGGISLVVVETDGSYTDHDVFKITRPGAAQLPASVFTTSLQELSRRPELAEHARRLTLAGMPDECRSCPVVEACGAGAIMHRFHPTRELDAPTVYCAELFALLGEATLLLRGELGRSSGMVPAAVVLPTGSDLVAHAHRWRRETDEDADRVAAELGVDRGSAAAAVFMLARHGALSDPRLPACGDAGTGETWLRSIRIQNPDPRLSLPFRETVRVLDRSAPEAAHGVAMLAEVERLLAIHDDQLPAAMGALLSDLLFVTSTVPDEGGIFSFSDDTAPNVLYIAPAAGGRMLSADDLGDSILHEFLHQVLHHIERGGPMLFDYSYPRFPAPWRAGLRTAGGFLHGTFVFAQLAAYWASLHAAGPAGVDVAKAGRNAAAFRRQAVYGIQSLRQFALLTPRGVELLAGLEDRLGAPIEPMPAPGVLPLARHG
jgi:uncharacterized protein